MTENDRLLWRRGNPFVLWERKVVAIPGLALDAAVIPGKKGIVVVTEFDETTMPDQPNCYAFLVPHLERAVPIRLYRGDRLVRFLGCYTEQGLLVLLGADDFLYYLDPNSMDVVDRRYYR
jgi:hypothetical protein